MMQPFSINEKATLTHAIEMSVNEFDSDLNTQTKIIQHQFEHFYQFFS